MAASSLLFIFTVICGLILASSWRSFVPSNLFQVKAPSDGGIPVTNSQLLKQSVEQVALTTAMLSSLSLGIVAPSLAEEVKKKVKKPKVLETELGIKYIILKPGSGPYPNPGDFVVVSYTAFLNNGTIFDSTDVKGRKPISFRLGKKQVIPGLESVVEYMQPGAEVTCTIPAKYAYGAKGVCVPNEGCLVPPNEDVKYALKLISAGAGYN